MVSILFLDDQYERWDMFFRRFIHLDIKWVKTADECIAALEEKDWDIISLDHDLGTEKNGMDVIAWMVTHVSAAEVVAIHSWNQPAASLMHQALYVTDDYEGNLYREVFGEKYLSDMEQIVGMFTPVAQ